MTGNFPGKILRETVFDVSILSNFTKKEFKSLVIALAREVAELTGETDSQLFAWVGQHAALSDFFKSRQTFYTWMARNGWQRRASRTLTQDCHLTSYPLSCRLRLRAHTWIARFSRDISRGTERQMVLLAGYEVCSRLLHVRLYQGPDYPIGDPAFPPCLQIPVATAASFVEEFAQMVGLPIQQVQLTQQWFPSWPPTPNAEQVYLSLSEQRLVVRPRGDPPGDNELPCSFAVEPGQQAVACRLLSTLPPFADWFAGIHPPEMVRALSDMVNLHNKENARSRLKQARQRLDELITLSQQKLDAKSTKWGSPNTLTAFQERVARHDYLGGITSLKDVRFCDRDCRRFLDFPGDLDRPRQEEETGNGGTQAQTAAR